MRKPRSSESQSRPGRSGRWGFYVLTLSLFGGAILIEILLMILLDRNFWYAKKEININQANPIASIPPIRPEIASPEIGRRKADPTSISDGEMEIHVRVMYGDDLFQAITRMDNPLIRLEIRNYKGESVFTWEAPNAEEKRNRLNTWENSLFTRGFEFPATSTRAPDLVLFFVNSPKVLDETRGLATQYRLYCAVITFVNFLVVFLIYRGGLRPLGQIAGALSHPPEETPPIITSPRHEAERAYNVLARNTRLVRTHSSMTDHWENLDEGKLLSSVEDREIFWKPVLETIRTGMSYRSVYWIPAVCLESEEWETVGVRDDRDIRLFDREVFLAYCRRGKSPSLMWFDPERDELVEEGASVETRPWFISKIFQKEKLSGFLVATPKGSRDSCRLELPYFETLAQYLSQILTRSLERSEQLDRERFEVSIDLSASMGHDLTNILATGKLELETLKTAFKRGIVQVPDEKRPMVEAAVEGLRNTTVLLQEVVNVYRAFSFTREPRFEVMELSETIGEVMELYRHSTSRPVTYENVSGEQKVEAFADPRLVKLVLFNLLANATQAITARQRESKEPPGKVEVDCLYRDGRAIFRVMDNGTGFRDTEGHRLEGVALDHIFHFDFSTKGKQGGLGLAWVKSIIEEIHPGNLTPANREGELGAIMEVHLPIPTEEDRQQAEKNRPFA
ncbi:MAG: hypothetical protein H6751_13235 [Candidatus Omnitrophica bacterium]|nr:hypothetical protein [Candidatus Omnitrophota bacterium]